MFSTLSGIASIWATVILLNFPATIAAVPGAPRFACKADDFFSTTDNCNQTLCGLSFPGTYTGFYCKCKPCPTLTEGKYSTEFDQRRHYCLFTFFKVCHSSARPQSEQIIHSNIVSPTALFKVTAIVENRSKPNGRADDNEGQVSGRINTEASTAINDARRTNSSANWEKSAHINEYIGLILGLTIFVTICIALGTWYYSDKRKSNSRDSKAIDARSSEENQEVKPLKAPDQEATSGVAPEIRQQVFNNPEIHDTVRS